MQKKIRNQQAGRRVQLRPLALMVSATALIGATSGNLWALRPLDLSSYGLDGITNAGAISGATSINATDNINGGSLSTSGNIIGGSLNVGNGATINGNSSLNGATNNIGSDAAHVSTNNIGNTNLGSAVNEYGGNSSLSLVNGTANLRSGTGATASGLTATSATQTLSTNPATLSNQLNNVGDAASRQNIAGASYVNRLEGNTLINGNTYINGTLVYTSNTSATTTVTSGQSILNNQATNGQMSIANSGGPGASVDANGRITTGTVNQTSASLTLTNGIGETHGLVVTEEQSTLSGGIHSSSLTLNDYGATFSNAQTGAPVQVHGVADGTSEFDAVNFRQLNSGLAMAAGLASIPQVDAGKKFSVGAGTGIYGGEASLAVGMSARVKDDWVVKAGVSAVPSNGQFNQMANAGVSYSW